MSAATNTTTNNGTSCTTASNVTRGITDHGFSFPLDILHSHNDKSKENDDIPSVVVELPQDLMESFRRDGFVVIPNVLDQETVKELNHHLDQVLRGIYDRNQKPDKSPPPLPSSSCPNNGTNSTKSKSKSNTQVLQVVNVHKCDSLFRQLAISPLLGHVVAQLGQWTHVGTRLAQDQLWAKPPGSPGLVFHRDSPYFMFDDPAVMTVWIALDTMDAELGPLEYIPGSHTWKDNNDDDDQRNKLSGIASPFFSQHDAGRYKLVQAAAAKQQQQGLTTDDATVTKKKEDPSSPSPFQVVSMAGLAAGGISIHDGRTWHGSGNNHSTSRSRRGLGLHYVPANVKFTTQAKKSQLWKPYVQSMTAEQLQTTEPDLQDFPITWKPNNTSLFL
jgi:phytanoyl-CoA hydroxylase